MVVVARKLLNEALIGFRFGPYRLCQVSICLVSKGKFSWEIFTFASTVIIQPSITHTSGLVFAEA